MNIFTCLQVGVASAAFLFLLPSSAASQTISRPTSLATSQAEAPKPAALASVAQVPTAAASSLELPAAPQAVSLTGVVVLDNGRPCPGASVYVAGAPRQMTVTDEQGKFVLPVPADSPLALKAEYFGVGTARLAIDKPSTDPLRIVLQ